VTYGQVVSTIQSVPGVAYVDLEALTAVDELQLATYLAEAEAAEAAGEEADTSLFEELQERITVGLAEPKEDDIMGDLAGSAENHIQAAQLAILSPDAPSTLLLEGIDL
jgi:hypothetical protein